jgi:hypothetical protein
VVCYPRGPGGSLAAQLLLDAVGSVLDTSLLPRPCPPSTPAWH